MRSFFRWVAMVNLTLAVVVITSIIHTAFSGKEIRELQTQATLLQDEVNRFEQEVLRLEGRTALLQEEQARLLAPRLETPGLVFDESGCYIVQKGDTLWKIALVRYGDARRWKEIYQWHRQMGIGPVPDRVTRRGGKTIVNIRPGIHLWLHAEKF